MPQFYSFVAMLGAGITRPNYCIRALYRCSCAVNHCMGRAQNRGWRNCKSQILILPSNFYALIKVVPMAQAMLAIP